MPERYFDFQKMDLLETFLRFQKSENLPLGKDSTTLLAVSGGLDSVAMLHLFHRAGFPFAVAHCNFQLRGEESEEDEKFVRNLAERLAVPFYAKRFDTTKHAESKGISTQMAARELRYAWFLEMAAQHGFECVATAHHLNDSVETALLNFVRGTGIAGLTGIAAKTDKIVRPMLFACREEILQYAQAQQIDWREDSSNAKDDYARNFIRHHVVPKFEELNPNFSHTVGRNLERISNANENLTFLLRHWLLRDGSDGQEGKFSIDKQRLALLPALQQALHKLLRPLGFDFEQARQLAENLEHVGLEILSAKGYKVLVDRKSLEISSVEKPQNAKSSSPIHVLPDDLMLRLPDNTRLFFVQSPEFQSMGQSPLTVCVDAGKLKYPLHLRHWQAGDSFQPVGMGGKSQKLQDYFTNQKLSRNAKEDVWLLFNGDEQMIWVLGMRLDERFRITDSTEKILKINWIK